MTTYLFVLLSLYLPVFLQPISPSIRFLFLIFLMTFLLPTLNFIFFRVTGTIKDLNLFDRSERILPFAFVTILYCIVTFMFYWKFPVPSILKLMMIITAMVVVSASITLWYKISVHSVGICGMVGMLLPLNNASEQGLLLYPTIGSLVIAGIVMSSRLQLNAHDPREVLIGGVVGFSIGFGGMYLLF
jgi:glucan phosphoethanolaminetransferase (alkaline phosphatase superfamily)